METTVVPMWNRTLEFTDDCSRCWGRRRQVHRYLRYVPELMPTCLLRYLWAGWRTLWVLWSVVRVHFNLYTGAFLSLARTPRPLAASSHRQCFHFCPYSKVITTCWSIDKLPYSFYSFGSIGNTCWKWLLTPQMASDTIISYNFNKYGLSLK